MVGITHGIQVHAHAKQQLLDLAKVDARAAAEIAVFLEELAGNEDWLLSLTDHGFEDDRFSISMVVELQKQRWNCWRITVFKIEGDNRLKLPYRILYVFDTLSRIYHVLAIEDRGTVYSRSTLDRVSEQCQGLGIRLLPRPA